MAVELASLIEQQELSETEIERQENEVAIQRAALQEIEGRMEQARKVANDIRARIGNHESRIVFNQEKASEFSGLVERYRADVAGGEEKLRVAETQLHETDAELEQITTLLASELRHMEEKQAAVASCAGQRAEADRALTTIAAEGQRLEQQLATLRGQISSVSQQREGAEARLAILSGELDVLGSSTETARAQKEQTESEILRTQNELESANSQVAAAESALRETQSRLAALDQEVRNVQRALSDKESKLEVVRALVASGEGFSQGTQAVLKGLDNPEFFKPAIQGALAQFIDVEPQFVAAVEACLGANMETVVMKDTMIAEAVVKALTLGKLGKASLAITEMDRAFSHVESSAMQLPEGAIDWLINKVTAKPEVHRLIERLINHTVLVADVETALRIFPQHGSAIVTLTGEILSGNGILHGGATKDAAHSLLERKNEVGTLEREAEAIRGQLAGLTERRTAGAAEIESIQERLENLREEKQSATTLLSTLRGQLANSERDLREAEKKVQSFEWERGTIEVRFREAEDKGNALESQVQASLSRIEELHAQRTEAQGELESLRAREAEAASELNELKIKVATERQRHTSLHHQRQPMEARLLELHELLEQRRVDIDTYDQRIASTLAETTEIESNLVGLRERQAVADLEVARQIDERAGIAAAAEESANELRTLRHRLSTCHEQRSKLEIRKSQLEMRVTALTEHIQKRYSLDLSTFERDLYALKVTVRDALKRSRSSGDGNEANDGKNASDDSHSSSTSHPSQPAPDESLDELNWDQIDAMVRELDQRIDSMGPVNVDAIQEYDELEERHAFLEKQNNDLINAKQELLDTITKINQTTSALFAETFEKIRVNFQEMFGELFGGGKANLLMTDASDPLESGIEIVAKPPGKQLTNISLLSGGERTMTAVALLFSIYMVKPSPFCVLDEMDAPLDESNISRFIKILDRFVGQSQFVVISHHKRTIARADALYGVTMEEHGVSKLVGVKFAKRDESHEGRDINGEDNPSVVPSVAETFGKSGSLHSEAMAAG
jgi:chromosome segregation protein